MGGPGIREDRCVLSLSGVLVISAEQFEREYAARSNTTVERLRACGHVVKRCKCGEAGCEGWQSISQSRVAEDEAAWRAGRYRAPDWIGQS